MTTNLTDPEARLPGARLLSLLLAEAARRGATLQAMAAELGVSYSYIAQLRAGGRAVPGVSDDFVSAAAQYLQLPRAVVIAAAGKLRYGDLYAEQNLVQAVNAAWGQAAADQDYPIPAEMDLLGVESKLFVIRLYERATGRVLLPPSTSRLALRGMLGD